jgi:hypothetical protein
MVDEMKFEDNDDKWQLWKTDHDAYNTWFEQKSGVSADPKKVAIASSKAQNAAPGANPTISGGDD